MLEKLPGLLMETSSKTVEKEAAQLAEEHQLKRLSSRSKERKPFDGNRRLPVGRTAVGSEAERLSQASIFKDESLDLSLLNVSRADS